MKEHTYEADWETVTSAFWVKYPTDKASHVKQVDTIHREIDTESQTLRVRRLMRINYDFPNWYRTLSLPIPRCDAIEDTVVRLPEKKLSVTAQNVTLCGFVNVREEYQYEVHPDNPHWTKYRIEHGVSLTGVGFLGNWLESKFIDKVREKFRDGLDIMTSRISSLQHLKWRERQSEWHDELAKMASYNANKIRENLLPEVPIER